MVSLLSHSSHFLRFFIIHFIFLKSVDPVLKKITFKLHYHISDVPDLFSLDYHQTETCCEINQCPRGWLVCIFTHWCPYKPLKEDPNGQGPCFVIADIILRSLPTWQWWLSKCKQDGYRTKCHSNRSVSPLIQMSLKLVSITTHPNVTQTGQHHHSSKCHSNRSVSPLIQMSLKQVGITTHPNVTQTGQYHHSSKCHSNRSVSPLIQMSLKQVSINTHPNVTQTGQHHHSSKCHSNWSASPLITTY